MPVTPTSLRLSVSSARFRVRITHLAKQLRAVVRRALQLTTSQTDQVVCRDEHRVYVWALLEADKALAPTDNMVSLTSPVSSVATISQRHRIPAPRRHHQPTERTPSRMSHNRIAATLAGSSKEATNGTARPVAEHNESADQSTSFGSVLREAEAVKASLRGAHSQVGHLIASLKRHRRQSKLMKTTLASIRQLQALDV